MTARSLGKLGPPEGPPVLFEWQWHHSVPSLALWILLGLLLVLPAKNRNWQAWLILVLPLAVAGFGQLLLVVNSPPTQLDVLFYVLFSLAVAWASVWLLAPWLRVKRRLLRALLAWIVMFAVGAVGYFGYFGLSFSGNTTGAWAVYWSMSTLSLVAAMTLGGYCCRRSYHTAIFMLWLALWMPLVCLASMVVLSIVMALAMGDLQILVAVLCSGLMVTAAASICLYVLNVPVMVLARFSPLYRERFHAVFCPLEPEPEPFDPMSASLGPCFVEIVPAEDEPGGECPFARPGSP